VTAQGVEKNAGVVCPLLLRQPGSVAGGAAGAAGRGAPQRRRRDGGAGLDAEQRDRGGTAGGAEHG
jgi:hypothetical protein